MDIDILGLLASSTRVRQMARKSQPQPGALVRLDRVLLGAAPRCGANAAFAVWFKRALDDFIDKFGNFISKFDDLTARLQATRRPNGHPTGRGGAVSPAAHLAGLHGNDLFRALMAMQLPTASPAEVCLEVAQAAQRHMMHELLDKFIDLVVGNTTAIHKPNFVVFHSHMETLDRLVQQHIHLADAADASSGAAK